MRYYYYYYYYVNSLQKVNLSLGRAGLFPSLRQRSQLVDGVGHVVAPLLDVHLLLLLLLGRPDRVRLLQRSGRAVRARVHRNGAGRRARRLSAGRGRRRAESRVARVLAAVRYGRRLGARGRRVEERLGQLAHAQRQLQRLFTVGVQRRVEQRLQVRLRVLVHPDHQVAVDGRGHGRGRAARAAQRFHLDVDLLQLLLLLLLFLLL